MSITEEQRHQLIRSLERTLGEKEAASLMELVPSIPWHEFATKRDLDDLATRMELRFQHQEERFDARIDVVEARTEAMLADAVNRLTFRLLPAMAAMIALFGAIAAFI